MENYSINEVIEQAVQTEKLGYEFYISMANKFDKDEKFRKFFETLAVKEQEHEKTFTGLKEKIGDQNLEGWEEASQYLRAIVESEFFLGKNKSLPSLDHLETIADVVRFAIGFEKETLLYFLSLKDVIKEKEIVNKIINEEKEHIVWLSDFRRSLA
ncbi:MAG: ferritin family protein [Nitrospirota bacterium]